jgi:hypothetical protein
MIHIPAFNIQMFAKTFDIVYENAMQEYLFRFAELAIEWRDAPNLPPPFNVLIDVLTVFKWLLDNIVLFGRCANQPGQPEQPDSKPFDLNSILQTKGLKREEWRQHVIQDYEENSDFSSESQQEKFKSTLLRRSKKLESIEHKLASLKQDIDKKMDAQQATLQLLLDRVQMHRTLVES